MRAEIKLLLTDEQTVADVGHFASIPQHARRLGDEARAALASEIEPQPLVLYAQPVLDDRRRVANDEHSGRVDDREERVRSRFYDCTEPSKCERIIQDARPSLAKNLTWKRVS
jgi:hypothetical protein